MIMEETWGVFFELSTVVFLHGLGNIQIYFAIFL